jgi:hypothetical protein
MYFYSCKNEQVATGSSMEAIEMLAGSPKRTVKTDHCAAGLEIKLVFILFIWTDDCHMFAKIHEGNRLPCK